MVFAGGKVRALLKGLIVGARPFEADVGETFCPTVRRRGGRSFPAVEMQRGTDFVRNLICYNTGR